MALSASFPWIPQFQLAWRNSCRKSSSLAALGHRYKTDKWTNVPPSILTKLERRVHLNPAHPIGILRSLIEAHFKDYKHLNALSPIVTTKQNFDDLGFPKDHPGRSKSDSYYINHEMMLRTHTSAHEVETFAKGIDKFLLTADVYRRDEIDASHYPVFHQMEGASVVSRERIHEMQQENERIEEHLRSSNIAIVDPTTITSANPYQPQHKPEEADIIVRNLKNNLNSMVLSLFGGLEREDGEPLQVRWIEAYFPFTSPSYEVEVFYQGKWLEILGCGVVQQKTLDVSSVPDKMGWAFGLGLERIAMVLFSIPDIRLFHTADPRFVSQFSAGEISTFKSYSKYPPVNRDLSFWLPQDEWAENDFFEVVRDVGGDLVEDVRLIDSFQHPKTGKKSSTYRINYRSMDRTISAEEANVLQQRIVEALKQQFEIEMR